MTVLALALSRLDSLVISCHRWNALEVPGHRYTYSRSSRRRPNTYRFRRRHIHREHAGPFACGQVSCARFAEPFCAWPKSLCSTSPMALCFSKQTVGVMRPRQSSAALMFQKVALFLQDAEVEAAWRAASSGSSHGLFTPRITY